MNHANHTASGDHYYVPPPSLYPVTVNLGLFILTVGFLLRISAISSGVIIMLAGAAITVFGVAGWIAKIICENEIGKYHPHEDRSFRIGMGYFIFSEIAFFGAFLMALMYLRVVALPDLASMDPHFSLWPDFKGAWPSGGPKSQSFTPLGASGLPAINAIILLASAVVLAWARKGLVINNRGQMIAGLSIAVALGVAFLFQQAREYHHASELGITLATGIYGTNFFALSGMHGTHLFAGIVMIAVLLLRAFHGQLQPESHVGLNLVAWYWNFVVVFPGLLVFVYFYWA